MLIEVNGYWIDYEDIRMMKAITMEDDEEETVFPATRIWFRNAPGSVDIEVPMSALVRKMARMGELTKEDMASLGLLDFPNSK